MAKLVAPLSDVAQTDEAYQDLVPPYIDALRRLVEEIANLHYLGNPTSLPITVLDAYREAKAALETWDELSGHC